jgi:hypothetical protein
MTVRLPLGLVKRIKHGVIQQGCCVEGQIRALLENHIEYVNGAPLPDPKITGERAYLAPWEDEERKRRAGAKGRGPRLDLRVEDEPDTLRIGCDGK